MRGNYSATNLDADMGLYAQDRWTMDRLTLSGAIRFDWFRTSFPEQTLGPGAARAEPEHHVPGSRQHQLEGPDLPKRPRL